MPSWASVSGGRHDLVNHGTVADDRDVGTCAHDLGFAEPSLGQWRRKRAFHGVERLVLDEQDRVGICNRGMEQRIGLVERRRADHLETGDVGEPPFQALRMLRPCIQSAAVLRADDQRHAPLPPPA